MNRQMIYDMVRDHLMNQGKRAAQWRPLLKKVECRYRGSNGTMCAIGCLIPDEKYDPSFEGRGVTGLPLDALVFAGVKDRSDVRFLEDLQDIHDDGAPASWARRFYDFAVEHGLRP